MTTADVLSWLLTYAVHSTLLLGGVALLTHRLVQSHGVRDILWKTALLGGFVTSTVQVGLGVEPLGGAMALTTAPATPATAPTSAAVATPIPGEPSATVATEATLKKADHPSAPETRERVASGAPSAAARPEAAGTWQERIVLLWLASAGLLLLYFFAVRLRLVVRLGRRRPVVDGPLPPVLRTLQRQSGIRRLVRLTTAAGLTSPVALGVAEICVPAVVGTDLDGEQQESMLAHELAHLARFDPLWLTLACLIEQLLFFQPLNRLARRRMQDAAEYLCDDWAVRRTGSGMGLAKCLVKVAEWVDTSPRAVPVSGMAAHRSQLVARIHRLIENRAMQTPLRYRWLAPAAALLLVVTALLAPGFTAGNTPPLDAQEPSQPEGRSAVRAPKVDVAAVTRSVQQAHLSQAVTIAAMADWKDSRQQDTTNPAVPALIAALADPDPGVRMAAAQSLGQLEDPRAIAPLIAATRDANVQVRSAAYGALSDFDDPRIVEPMIAALKDPDADVRQEAAHTLGHLEDKRAVTPLLGALADSSADVRRAAAQSLGELQDPAAASALAGALKDRDAEVRMAAAQSLGELELSTAPPALIAALKDSDAEVRQAAAQSLGEIRDPSAVAALRAGLADPNAEVRESSVQALGEIRDSTALNALIGALKSPDAGVREQAAQALGQRP